MMPGEYSAQIYRAYQDEIGGEAFFLAMSDLLKDPDHSYKMCVLAQLELETGQLLKSILAEPIGDLTDDIREREMGRLEASHCSNASWHELMILLRDDLPEYISRYKELEKAGRVEDLACLWQLTKHEEALFSFCEQEIIGQSGQSLEPVIHLLGKIPDRTR